ncbi:MAG: hypothetical protein ACLTS6_18315 [Anaerobutyricum sp.]
MIVSDLYSLGLTTEDILNRLDWFISHNVCLFICKYSTTYEYGMMQLMNKAVLTTLLQSMLNTHKNIVEIPRKQEIIPQVEVKRKGNSFSGWMG